EVRDGGGAAPARGREDREPRRRPDRAQAGRIGRDRGPRPDDHEGLLAATGRDRGGDSRRLVLHGRHRARRRRGLLRDRGAQDGLRQDPQAGAPRAGTGPGGPHLTGGRPSSTSRTLRTRASDENGFFRRAVSRSTTLRRIMPSSTYPDV